MKTALIFENTKYFLKYLTKIYDKETREMQVQNHRNFLPLMVVWCCKPFQVVKLYVQEQIVDTGKYVLLWKWLCSITCFLRHNKYTHRYPFFVDLPQFTFWFYIRSLPLLYNHFVKSDFYNCILLKHLNLWLELKQIKSCRMKMVKGFEALWE